MFNFKFGDCTCSLTAQVEITAKTKVAINLDLSLRWSLSFLSHYRDAFLHQWYYSRERVTLPDKASN